MGAVHLGSMVTPAGTRNVAIKQLLTERGSATATECMAAEARLVFQLTHANVCQVIDLAVNDAGTFIVMEHVDGCDLHTLLRRGPLEIPAAVHIAREVAMGLDYAHRRNDEHGRPLMLVHGDIKPSNILLSREGEVKLADFGIARTIGAHAPGNRISGGTPGFLAPEASLRLDQRSDIYALGVTLYVALGGNLRDGRVSLEALAATNPALGPELMTILERATAQQPDRRYTTASELEEALGLLLGHNYPSFKRSVIGQLVARRAPVNTATRERELTLVSLTHPSVAASRPETGAGPTPVLATKPAVRRRTQRRRRWILPSLLSCGLALALASWRWRAPAAAGPATAPAGAIAAGPSPAELPAPPATLAPGPAGATAPSAVTASPSAGDRSPASSGEPSRVHGAKARGNTRPVHKGVTRTSDPSRDAAVDPSKSKMGYLTVNASPWGEVLVDGRQIAAQTPAYRIPVTAGPHRVTVYNPERKAQAPLREIDVQVGEVSVVGFKW
jgi:serine/threonine-protein kinase